MSLTHAEANATSNNRKRFSVKPRRAWVVVVDGAHISVGENFPDVGVYSSSSIFAHSECAMDREQAIEYLETAAADAGFHALILVGEVEDLREFRGILPESLRQCVVGEIIRPNRSFEFFDKRMEEIYSQ